MARRRPGRCRRWDAADPAQRAQTRPDIDARGSWLTPGMTDPSRYRVYADGRLAVARAHDEKPDRQLHGAGHRLAAIGAAVGALDPLTARAAGWAKAVASGRRPSYAPAARRARRVC